MIGSPKGIGDKDPKDWIREFLGYFEGVRFEFMRVRGLWFPALYNGPGDSIEGRHPGKLLLATESGYISCIVPRGTSEIKQAVIRIIPTTTGTIDWTLNASFAAAGEDEANTTGTATANGLSVTDDQITEIDVTSAFSSATQDDQVGVQFTVDALSTTTNVHLLGLYLKARF